MNEYPGALWMSELHKNHSLLFFFLYARELFNSSMTRVTCPSFILQSLICCVIISSCPDVSMLEIFRQHQYWQHLFSCREMRFYICFLFRLATCCTWENTSSNLCVVFSYKQCGVFLALEKAFDDLEKEQSCSCHKTYFPLLLAPGEKCAPCNTQEYLLTLPLLHGLSGLSPFTQKNTFVLKDCVCVETIIISIVVIFQA